MHWVHRYYWKGGPEGNDIQKTNVPNLRMRFRCASPPRITRSATRNPGGAPLHLHDHSGSPS